MPSAQCPVPPRCALLPQTPPSAAQSAAAIRDMSSLAPGTPRRRQLPKYSVPETTVACARDWQPPMELRGDTPAGLVDVFADRGLLQCQPPALARRGSEPIASGLACAAIEAFCIYPASSSIRRTPNKTRLQSAGRAETWRAGSGCILQKVANSRTHDRNAQHVSPRAEKVD